MARSRADRRRGTGRDVIGAVVLLHLQGPLAAAEGDPERGERMFQRCYACHSVDPAETGLEGPTLHGVVGRPAGAVDGFAYSDALRARAAEGLVWDEPALDAFLADPPRASCPTTRWGSSACGTRTRVPTSSPI